MSHNRYKLRNGPSKVLHTAFTPRAKLEQSHALISNHMKAHYKRISSVQAKIDSHTPTSMLKSIKDKEHQTPPSKNVSYDPVTCDKHLYIDHDGRPDSSGKNFRGNLASSHTEEWRHYVTKTGRLTGYLINTRNGVPSSKNEGKEIWKPAFSRNDTSSLNTNYPSLNQSAKCELDSYGLKAKTKSRITNGSESDDKDFEPEEGYNVSYGGLTASIHSPAKNYVTNDDIKEDERKRLQRQEELEYLGFISGITQDILSRRCLSDTAVELLIGCHIERNLHRLDKDKMMDKVAELKEQLGCT